MRVFDSHFHIIDRRFPLVPNEGYLPDEFTVADYCARATELGIVGGAVVSGSFQAFDQTYLLAALQLLGPAFVGVTQLPASTPDAEIRRLDAAGVRAVRFNLRRGGSAGGSAGLSDLVSFAWRVHDLARWHVELYVDGRDLPELYEVLVSLPALVIDHPFDTLTAPVRSRGSVVAHRGLGAGARRQGRVPQRRQPLPSGRRGRSRLTSTREV